MGMFDEVAFICPKCNETNIFQSKFHECKLATYTLENAPLLIIADLNEDSKQDKVYCSLCRSQLEVVVRFMTFVRVKDGDSEPENYRES